MNKYASILSLSAAMAVVSGCSNTSGSTPDLSPGARGRATALAVPSVTLAEPEYLSKSSGQLRASVYAEKQGSGIYYLPDINNRDVLIVIVESSGANVRSVFMRRNFSWFPSSTQEKILQACEKAGNDVPVLRAASFNLTDSNKVNGEYVITDPVSGYVCVISEFGDFNTPPGTMKLTYGAAGSQTKEIQEIHQAQLSAYADQSAVAVPAPALK